MHGLQPGALPDLDKPSCEVLVTSKNAESRYKRCVPACQYSKPSEHTVESLHDSMSTERLSYPEASKHFNSSGRQELLHQAAL